MPRRIVILTEGHTNPRSAKTASCLLRYCPDEVLALLDSTQAGRTSCELLATGGDTPIVASLDEAADANTLLLGIAPPGGQIPVAWYAVIRDAISRGWDVVSGLHEFLTDNPELVAAARQHGVQLTDVRKNEERDVATRSGLRADCLRVLTVGHDCSIGKMVTSVELTRGLQRAGRDAFFVATGQTGMMVSGAGIPIDRVISDFASGAIEKEIKRHQHHEMLIVEGQASLVHPSYSGVTLSLLHGAAPHALILCYAAGHEQIYGAEHLALPPLAKFIELNETLGSIFSPCKVIGIAMNSSNITAAEAAAERQRRRDEFGLPICDPLRDGPDELVDAVVRFHASSQWRTSNVTG